jgi:hypothetical protein
MDDRAVVSCVSQGANEREGVEGGILYSLVLDAPIQWDTEKVCTLFGK